MMIIITIIQCLFREAHYIHNWYDIMLSGKLHFSGSTATNRYRSVLLYIMNCHDKSTDTLRQHWSSVFAFLSFHIFSYLDINWWLYTIELRANQGNMYNRKAELGFLVTCHLKGSNERQPIWSKYQLFCWERCDIAFRPRLLAMRLCGNYMLKISAIICDTKDTPPYNPMKWREWYNRCAYLTNNITKTILMTTYNLSHGHNVLIHIQITCK